MSKSGPKGSERRRQVRHLTCLATLLGRSQKEGIAVISDISVGGALLLTRHRPAIGEQVEVSLPIDSDGLETSAMAKVVRAEPRPKSAADLWRYSVAIRFEEPLHHLQKEIEDLAAKQKTNRGEGAR